MDDDNPKNKCDEFINGSQNNRIMINDDVQNPGWSVIELRKF